MQHKYHTNNIKKLRSEFLSEAQEIIEKPSSPLGHFFIILIGVIVISFILLMVFGKLDETVTARGSIVMLDQTQKIQTINGGVLEEINVEEGQDVKKGEILFRISNPTELIQLEYNSSLYKSLQYTEELLEKIAAGEKIERETQSDPEKDKIFASIKAIYDSYICDLNKEEENIEVIKQQYEYEKSTLALLYIKKESLSEKKSQYIKLYGESNEEEEKLKILQERYKIIEKEFEDYKVLYQSDAITKFEYREKENQLLEIGQQINLQEIAIERDTDLKRIEIQNYESQIEELIQQIKMQEEKIAIEEQSIELEKCNLEQMTMNFCEKINTKIAETTQEKQRIMATLEQCQELYNNNIIYAPCDGTVRLLCVGTIGEVLSPTQLMAEVIPNNSGLIFEAGVTSKDIAYITINQEVNIKLDSYNYQKYGKWKGKVIYISPDAIVDEHNQYFYKIKIEMEDNTFGSDGLEIIKGMTGTSEIKTGERRMIQFFFEPLFEHFDGSLNVR